MPGLQENELTLAEKIAKEKFIHLIKCGNVPCDIDDTDILPSWYDEEKFKQGQKYFHDNRPGILNSNLIGLICLLAEPKGLSILASTGKSSTTETARKRYISTILHTLSWYEVDLTPGSKSRKSLATVRKMHFAASNSAHEKSIGYITQRELAITAFGFMGLVLVRPEVLGISTKNSEDREAFVHQWAVLCSMIGIKDEFNICLLPVDALEILCKAFIRYIILPLVQIELPLFQDMTKAMLEGLKDFLPFTEYESQMFLVRSILGLPGYQYKIKPEHITLCRSILNENDVKDLSESAKKQNIDFEFLFVDIPLVEISKIDKYTSQIKSIQIDTNMNHKTSIQSNIDMNELEMKTHSKLELKNTECLKIYCIDYENEWENILNDKKFFELSTKAQNILNIKHYQRLMLNYSITKYFVDSILSIVLKRMEKEGHSMKARQSEISADVETRREITVASS